MANVIFDRSLNATSEPIEDGKITFSTSGDGKIYLDNGSKRLTMGGAITVDSSPSTSSTNPIQNKAVTNNFPRNTDVVNTLSSAVSVNQDSIPCGTKPVKELNNKLGGLTFGKTSEGEWGYKPSGADTVIPFKHYNNKYLIGYGNAEYQFCKLYEDKMEIKKNSYNGSNIIIYDDENLKLENAGNNLSKITFKKDGIMYLSRGTTKNVVKQPKNSVFQTNALFQYCAMLIDFI